MLSMQKRIVSIVRNTVSKILSDSSMAEFKWSNLSSAKDKFGAEELIRYAVSLCCHGDARVDVLIWDTHDDRHKVMKRNDTANMGRMYFHLMKNVANKRWSESMRWHFHPDEQSSMDWDTLAQCINHATRRSKLQKGEQGLFTPHALAFDFRIDILKQRSSIKEPIIQIADLFAGLAVYSRNSAKTYCDWVRKSTGQGDLFDTEVDPQKFSKSDKNRCELIQLLLSKCKDAGLSLSMESSSGLYTRNPDKPINFWPYKPQHPDDKAPTKQRKYKETL